MSFVGLSPKVSRNSSLLFCYLIKNGIGDKDREVLTSLCKSKAEVNFGILERLKMLPKDVVESCLG